MRYAVLSKSAALSLKCVLIVYIWPEKGVNNISYACFHCAQKAVNIQQLLVSFDIYALLFGTILETTCRCRWPHGLPKLTMLEVSDYPASEKH